MIPTRRYLSSSLFVVEISTVTRLLTGGFSEAAGEGFMEVSMKLVFKLT
jgi:hypothetical protein